MGKTPGLSNLSVDTGIIPKKDLEVSPSYPSEENLKKGPVVLVECTEKISCNPCETVCKRGAIVVGELITNVPRLNPEKCNGCGLCIPKCPGLAIFLIDATYSEDKVAISFPHEYLPLPRENSEVEAVNRRGEVICKGKVVRVRNPESYDHTAVVTISIPKKYIHEARGVKRYVQGYKGLEENG